ncbi:hypothetical protein S7335_4406 [Synechococcus sp. PCC 7335]|uniref:hypothetical protein n=1 Tax=Synechococcus sp. (strain ATCC 29403 / PCC 7335) TaxID=91464 RepID=UPI00017EB132|nr:hypothetical protein [Synechococcus sp. PCC 7335]EDX86700.1 hypothetical protein S7335_4406 [Synechococcus sp. PCC 7335]
MIVCRLSFEASNYTVPTTAPIGFITTFSAGSWEKVLKQSLLLFALIQSLDVEGNAKTILCGQLAVFENERIWAIAP